jgi:hypothetical protein
MRACHDSIGASVAKAYSGGVRVTSGKRAFGLDPLVPASIWAGTKGPATSPQNDLADREALVPARNEPLVPV